MLKQNNIVIFYPELGEKSAQVIFKTTTTRNIRISLNSSLQAVVSFPKRYRLESARKFFESKIIWVKNSLNLLEKRQEINQKIHQQNQPELSPEKFLAKNHYLILRCLELAKKHNFPVNKVSLRRQKTIWGSCSFDNKISLNANLAFLNDHLIDYVILHELVHTKIKNHSKEFWDELEKVLPNCKILNRDLKNFCPTFRVG